MKRLSVFAVSMLVLALAGWCGAAFAEEGAAASRAQDVWDFLSSETMTHNWFTLGDTLNEHGIVFGASVTNVYQHLLRGGADKNHDAYSGSYDLTLDVDLGQLVGLTGGRVYVAAEGSWKNGIDPRFVGSLMGVNADAAGNEEILLGEMFYEQSLLDGKIIARVGRVDLTGSFQCRGCEMAFDANTFANDQTGQFLNGAFVNNPTIPFPDVGPGAMLVVHPIELWYIAAGIAGSNANQRTSGLHETFDGNAHFFYIGETGLRPEFDMGKGPLSGAYRVGVWYDPQSKGRLDGNGRESDTLGVYVSADQMLWKENDRKDDAQGLGAFARWGFTDKRVSVFETFWSGGLQYRGAIPTRDNDVVAVGVATGILSGDANLGADDETALEAYYDCAIFPWLHVAPDIQFVRNPGGDSDVQNAIVAGVRVQIRF